MRQCPTTTYWLGGWEGGPHVSRYKWLNLCAPTVESFTKFLALAKVETVPRKNKIMHIGLLCYMCLFFWVHSHLLIGTSSSWKNMMLQTHFFSHEFATLVSLKVPSGNAIGWHSKTPRKKTPHSSYCRQHMLKVSLPLCQGCHTPEEKNRMTVLQTRVRLRESGNRARLPPPTAGGRLRQKRRGTNDTERERERERKRRGGGGELL